MNLLQEIRELYARLAELTADELTHLFELIEQCTSQLAEIPPAELDAEVVSAMQELADIRDGSLAEQTTREEAVAAREEEAAAALARLRGEQTDTEASPEGDPDDNAAEGVPDPEAPGDPDGGESTEDAPAEGDQPAEGDDEGANAGTQAQPIAAAAPRAPARRPAAFGAGRGSQRQSAPPAPQVTALVASADVQGVPAGSVLDSEEAVGAAMVRMLQSIGHSGGGSSGYTLHPVAGASVQFTEDRILDDSEVGNRRKIKAALEARRRAVAELRGAGEDALVAAGGLCAPAETRYEINVLGSVARPVRGAFPSFGATRGAVQLRPNVGYRSLEGAITDWTMTNDANPGSDGPATKNIVDIVCPTPFTTTVEGGVLRIRFKNVTARFDPEVVGANTRAAQIAFARHQENKLLAKMDAKLKTLTAPKVLGATRDILATIDKSQAYVRSRYRMEDAVPLQMILPQWVKELIRTDITRQMATDLDALAVADAQIIGWFTRRNIAITFHLDGSEADVAAGGGAPAIGRQSYANVANNGVVPGYPDQLVMRMWADGDFLYLNGGQLDLGVVRDSGLNAVNAYETFFEEFDGLAFNGEEALKVVATVQPTGGSAGTVDTAAIAD